MTTAQQRLITRNEIACMLSVSTDVVRRNEAKLGLNACRVTVSRQTVRYRKEDALKALKAIGAY